MLEINLEISKIINQYEEMLEKLFLTPLRWSTLIFAKLHVFKHVSQKEKFLLKLNILQIKWSN